MATPETDRDDPDRTAPVYRYDAAAPGFTYAIDDFRRAISRPRFVWTMVRSTFLAQYRGATLGAFWITLTTLATITGLAVVYAQILGEPLDAFFGYVAAGVIVWSLLADLVLGGTSALVDGSVVYRQAPLPRSIFVLRMVGLALVSFAFRIPVLIGVLAFSGTFPAILDSILAVLGLCLIVVSGVAFGFLAGTVGARFRDLGQLVGAALMFAFFLTPIFWQPGRLGRFEFIVDYNPLHHFIHTIRGPLLGLDGVMGSFLWAGGVTIVLTLTGAFVFGAFARRLSYWS